MFGNNCICALLIYCIYALWIYCTYALLLYTIFVASNLKKKALPFIRIYTYFFCLNDKLSSVSEKNNTAFFLRSKDNYVAQTFIFNEVQKVLLKVLFLLLPFFWRNVYYLALLYMLYCVFQTTNLVNNYGQRKSARTFVSGLELAINYIRCCTQAFIHSLFL
jgi:hypothetical protein